MVKNYNTGSADSDNVCRNTFCRSCHCQRFLYYNFYRSMLCIRGTSHGSVFVCPSVCLSVRPSQIGVLLKRLNVGSHKQHHTIAQGLLFSDARDLREIRPGVIPYEAAECSWGESKSAIFDQQPAISRKRYKIDT